MKSGQVGIEVPEITIKLLREEEFSQYRDPWNKLLDSSTSESFFLKWEWVYTFWETIDKKNTVLLVWLCYHRNELVGIAPWYVYPSRFLGIPVRKVAFLADRVASDYMDIFAKPGYEETCCRVVLQRMQGHSPVAYDLIDLDAVCSDSNLYLHLSTGSSQARDIMMLPGFECPRTLLDTTPESYTSKLSSSTRYALGRKQRKFERDFDKNAIENLDLARHPLLLDVLFGLHKDRWDTLVDKTSTFDTAFRKSFNEQLLKRLGKGDGFFSCVTVNEEPVSILYILSYKGNAFFYQNGWDPSFAKYSIGIYNIQQAIGHAIEEGYKSFDFLRGEEAYKYKFCEEVRQAYYILQFGKGLLGRVTRLLFKLKLQLKNLLHRYLQDHQSLVKMNRLHSFFLQGQGR